MNGFSPVPIRGKRGNPCGSAHSRARERQRLSLIVRLAVALLPTVVEQLADTLNHWFARSFLRSFFLTLIRTVCLPTASVRRARPMRLLLPTLRRAASRLHALSTVTVTATPLRLTERSFCFLLPPSFSSGGRSLAAIVAVAFAGAPRTLSAPDGSASESENVSAPSATASDRSGTAIV